MLAKYVGEFSPKVKVTKPHGDDATFAGMFVLTFQVGEQGCEFRLELGQPQNTKLKSNVALYLFAYDSPSVTMVFEDSLGSRDDIVDAKSVKEFNKIALHAMAVGKFLVGFGKFLDALFAVSQKNDPKTDPWADGDN